MFILEFGKLNTAELVAIIVGIIKRVMKSNEVDTGNDWNMNKI